MKQVININFQGRIVPIEVTAYEILKSYIESLSRHFDAEEGKDEIINDIENRIGELFQERIKAGATCIIDDDVNAIIKSIGRPEDFDDAEPAAGTGTQSGQQNNQNANQNQSSFTTASGKKRLFRDENHKLVGGVCSGIANYFDIDIAIVRIVFAILFFTFGIGFIPYIILWIAVPSSATSVIGSRRKKLFRDTDDKYIGGVCSGIAHYFGINVWIPRALFLIPFLSFAGKIGHFDSFIGFDDFNIISFSPGALFIYVIFWLVLPEANSTAEKLEMKGEKVDMNSIKETVVEEMKGVQERLQKFGKEASNVANNKSRAFGTEASNIARKSGGAFGNIIALIVKGFVYFILGTVAFALVVSLFSVGILSINKFPLKDFLLTDGWQNGLGWGTLIFFIIVPMIGIITWVIRKITKVKTGSKMLRLGFIAMWFVGLICLIALWTSLQKDFRYKSIINEQQIAILNPTVNALEVTNLKGNVRYNTSHWYRNDFFDIDDNEDVATIKNVEVHIAKSSNDSFRVTTMKFANGSTKTNANTLSDLINFNINQKDSTLIIDKGITINKKDKFRNQQIVVTIYVPIGKRIKVQNGLGWMQQLYFDGGFSFGNRNDNVIVFDNIENGWNENVWYTMTKYGLVTLDGKPASSGNKNGIRRTEKVVIDGETIYEKIEEDAINDESGSYRYESNAPVNKLDSAKINLKKEEKRFKDSLEQQKKKIDKQLEKYNNSTTSIYNVLPNNLLMSILN